MSENLEGNPFTALFGSIKDAEHFRKHLERPTEGIGTQKHPEERIYTAQTKDNESAFIARLLLASSENYEENFTYVLINDVPPLTTETVNIILFERLLLEDPLSHIQNIKENSRLKEEQLDVVGRTEVVIYLFEVYERCSSHSFNKNNIAKCIQDAVLTNISTALQQPDIFSRQDPFKQLKNLIISQLSSSACLAELLTRLLENENSDSLTAPFNNVFVEVLKEVKNKLEPCSLMSVEWSMIDIIDFFASSNLLAPLLLVPPKSGSPGRQFQSTTLGSLLSISCLPKGVGKQKCEFFDKPSSQGFQVHKATENSIGVAQKAVNSRTYKIFMSLLKGSSTIRDQLLRWIEGALEMNAGRGGLWHIQGEELRSMSFVCDGFMVNLGAVLLQLASPFTKDSIQSDNKNFKILKVDPRYCVPSLAEKNPKVSGLYSGDLPKQTPLVPPHEENDSAKANYETEVDSFSFTTTCFFHTHRALHLGIQVVHQKLFKLSQDLGRLQHEYQEVSSQGSPASEMMQTYMEGRTSLFLSYKAAVFEPALVDDILDFLSATSLWLIQVAVRKPTSTLPFKEVTVADLNANNSSLGAPTPLRYVPELLAENLVESLIAVKRYMPEALTLSGESHLKLYLSFIATFMGSTHWMNNPHLRARLAECFEALLPKEGESSGLLTRGARECLIRDHSLAPHFVSAIIHVFVSIEMTGQSVAFEEKFNYRRPMYEVMKYLWDVPEHREQFVALANEALANMESAKPPLFLRFVNLLMNDAIFLLDEGLSYMSQIREAQNERDAGEWDGLSTEQRGERSRNMQQMSSLARFHNMLGSRTIQTLIRLTQEIPAMFTHPTLIDRMAGMLNHFLAHLVGPKQRDLKVRDMEKYEFRPSEIVSDICTIIIHLSKKPVFSVAVSADDRSYSPELFVKACNVLTRIGRYQLSQELEEFGKSVSEASLKRNDFEDLAANAPDEFIDPIMNHLMTDPVMLPSSHIVVDRQTIARHLLSDQTDPFNRMPLTMEEIVSEEQLKNKIQDWLKDQRKKV